MWTGSLLALALAVAALTAVACGGNGHGGSHGADAAGNEVDAAFVAQMIPHHELAVAMAEIAERRGRHREVKSLARTIIGTQEREIKAMKTVAAALDVTPAAAHGGMHGGDAMAGDAKTLGLAMDQMGMSMSADDLETASPFDRAFIDMMVPHHQGAIRMARAELADGTNTDLKRLATQIVAAQSQEIQRMDDWRTAWYGEPVDDGP